MTFGWELIPNILTAVLCFAMAAVLVYLRFDHVANQALAAALLLRGTWQTAGVLAEVVEGGQAAFWNALFPYFLVPYALAITYLVLVYPRPRGRVGRSRWTPAILAVIGATSVVAYGWDHSLWTGANGEAGPVLAAYAVGRLIFPLGALALARSFVQAEDGRERWSLLLMSLGFSLILAYNVLVDLGANLEGGQLLPLNTLSSGPAGTAFLPALVYAVLYLVLVGYLADKRLRTRDPVVRSGFTGYLIVLGTVASTFLIASADPGGQGPELHTFFNGFWDLALPLVVAYALLRHQLFGVDAKVRFGISRTTVAGIFVAVFFVVSEGAQALFADFAGNELFGVIAAGLLVFVISPLQRLADRFAEKAVPAGGPDDRVPGPTRDSDRAEELYRYACEKAYGDGDISREEGRKLEDLADELSLGAGEAMRIRREVEEEHTGGGEAA